MSGGPTDLGGKRASCRAGNWLGGVGCCDAGDEATGYRCHRGSSSDGDSGDGDDWKRDGTRAGDRVGGRAVGDRCRCRAEGSQAGQRDGREGGRVGLGQRAPKRTLT